MNDSGFIVRSDRYLKKINETFEKICSEKISERIWRNDFTVWSDKPDEIVNRLGWLHSPEVTGAALEEINELVDEVRGEGFKNAIVLGMGGSSMAPEVFGKMFGTKPGYLDLHILDSTDPGAVIAFDKILDPAKTLYIVSTKSGSTVETFSYMKHFYNATLKKVGNENAGKHFIAITDPKSGLVDTAEELKFRKIFRNDPNIGGRYSALSFFGMVPAALAGVDLAKIIERAGKIINESKSDKSSGNSGAFLGAILGELGKEGVDKVTFITPGKISYFGAWVEQLIAESTGKNGKGILPVDGEKFGLPDFILTTGCLFIFILKMITQFLKKLMRWKKPVIRLLKFSGMIFTILAANISGGNSPFPSPATIGIQPFDQPNVESAKILAKKMVKEYREKGKLPELKPALEENGISVFGNVKEKTWRML